MAREILPPQKIYVKESTIPQSGRGVFAKDRIANGEIVEVAPIIVLDFSDFIETRWNLMFEYYYWLDEYVVLALGYGSLYNHSTNPNCDYIIDRERRRITYTAIRNITQDEEILLNYRGSSGSSAPLWFERDK